MQAALPTEHPQPTNQTNTPNNPNFSSLFWPALVVALLLGHVLLLTVAATKAISAGHQTVPGYQDGNLSSQDEQKQMAASAHLGWSVELTAEKTVSPRGMRTITLRPTDAQGQPILDAAIKLAYYHQADGNLKTITAFEPHPDGSFTAQVPMRKSGHHHFQVTVQAQAAGETQTFFHAWNQFIF